MAQPVPHQTEGILLPDHPGWVADAAPQAVVWRRAVRQSDGSCCVIEVEQRDGVLAVRAPELSRIPVPTAAIDLLPDRARAEVGEVKTVLRLSTPSPWEALATAVIRQVIRADHARTVYRRVCSALGTPIRARGRTELAAFPEPTTLLARSDRELAALGLGFKIKILRRLGETRMFGEQLSPETLTATSGVGPWTSKVCMTDLTSDFSHYPLEDLVVRALAKRFWPDVVWPGKPLLFAQAWTERTAPHTVPLTALLLAHALQTRTREAHPKTTIREMPKAS